MSYTPYYPNGWRSGETGGTPITPEALNHMETGIKQTYSEFAPAIELSTYKGCYYRYVNDIAEWINPPMVLGTEYRTTERHNGKAVYAKAVNIGALPASGSKNVAHGISASAVYVGYEVFVYNGTITQQFPFLNASTGAAVGKVHVTAANIAITVFSDASAYSGTAILRYTRD